MKPLASRKPAHGHRDAVAQHQVALHRRAPQIQHPVGQPRRFRQVLVVDLERRRHARVQHFEFVAQHFDLAAAQVGVVGAAGAGAHHADDLQAVLVAHILGGGEHVGAVRVAHHLHQPFAVAQVDEDDAAVVASAVGPAHQRDGLRQQAFIDEAAVGGSQLSSPRSSGLAGMHRRHRARPSAAPTAAAACGAVQPIGFRAAAGAAAGGRPGGATTPIEMMYFSASSTLIASGTTSARGIIRKKPEVGFGVVGT